MSYIVLIRLCLQRWTDEAWSSDIDFPDLTGPFMDPLNQLSIPLDTGHTNDENLGSTTSLAAPSVLCHDKRSSSLCCATLPNGQNITHLLYVVVSKLSVLTEYPAISGSSKLRKLLLR